MKTNLKDFVESNRDEFDHLEPGASSWKRISSRLFGRGLWDSVVVWRAAAMFFIAVSAGLYVVPRLYQHHTNKEMTSQFRSVESFYQHEINEKVSMIDEHHHGLNGFTNDFQQLEAMYAVLKEQMQKQPSEKVRDALVLNLLVRVDLLNQELHKLEVQGDKNGKSSI